MKKRVIIIISWISVIIWMGVIFMFSNQNSKTSLEGSRGIIKEAVNVTLDTSMDLGIIKEKPTENEILSVSNVIDFPFRKIMHISEYIILSILVLNALYQSGIKNKKQLILSLVICFLYASTDEFHQSFLDRTAKFTDVLIDSCGAAFGLVIYFKALDIYRKRVIKKG